MKLMTTMKTAGLAVLASGLVATSAIADGRIERLNSGTVLPTTLPFSELVIAGDTLYLSGQIGNIPGSLTLAEGGIVGQTKQVMDNIKTSLNANGFTMAHLVKCTVMLDDISEWGQFNQVYKSYFKEGQFPARAAFGADGLAVGARVEVDCIGAR
jgi:2-iminobutanoate/2-iminopropanoate deaminase